MSDVQSLDGSAIERIDFFKRDLLTYDLICCEIITAAQTLSFHEEWSGWPNLIARLQRLDWFRKDWFSHVNQPPFEECRLAFGKAAS